MVCDATGRIGDGRCGLYRLSSWSPRGSTSDRSERCKPSRVESSRRRRKRFAAVAPLRVRLERLRSHTRGRDGRRASNAHATRRPGPAAASRLGRRRRRDRQRRRHARRRRTHKRAAREEGGGGGTAARGSVRSCLRPQPEREDQAARHEAVPQGPLQGVRPRTRRHRPLERTHARTGLCHPRLEARSRKRSPRGRKVPPLRQTHATRVCADRVGRPRRKAASGRYGRPQKGAARTQEGVAEGEPVAEKATGPECRCKTNCRNRSPRCAGGRRGATPRRRDAGRVPPAEQDPVCPELARRHDKGFARGPLPPVPEPDRGPDDPRSEIDRVRRVCGRAVFGRRARRAPQHQIQRRGRRGAADRRRRAQDQGHVCKARLEDVPLRGWLFPHFFFPRLLAVHTATHVLYPWSLA